MAIQFQALHFSLYGPEFRHEACHRKLNLELIVDAMRRVLDKEDKEEFREFVNDVNAENNVPNQLDGMRYKSAQVHKSLQMSLQKRYSEPTPKYWRQVGDFALVMLVAIQPMVDSMPISSNGKYWVDFALTILLVGIKFWTNTKSIHSSIPLMNDPSAALQI